MAIIFYCESSRHLQETKKVPQILAWVCGISVFVPFFVGQLHFWVFRSANTVWIILFLRGNATIPQHESGNIPNQSLSICSIWQHSIFYSITKHKKVFLLFIMLNEFFRQRPFITKPPMDQTLIIRYALLPIYFA